MKSKKNTTKFINTLMNNQKIQEYLKDTQFIQKLEQSQKAPQQFMIEDPKILETIMEMLDHDERIQLSLIQDSQNSDNSDDNDEDNDDDNFNNTEFKQNLNKQATENNNKIEISQQQAQKNDEAERLKNLGNNEFKKRNFEKAIEFYDKSIILNPTEVLYYSNKAACYIEMKLFDQANQAVDQAFDIAQKTQLKDNAKLAKLYARKAKLCSLLKQFDEAIQFYEKSLKEENNDKIKIDLQQIIKSQSDSQNQINPEKANEHNEKGRQLFQAGKFQEALKEYQEAIQRNPADAKLYSNEAQCYIKLMEFKLALKTIQKCLELNPKFVKGYQKKGQILVSLREYHLALEAFTQGLKIDPNNQECKDGIILANRKIYYEQDNPQDEEERKRQALADPEIQTILNDNSMRDLLIRLQKSPGNAEDFEKLQDPNIMKQFNILMQAGILKII